MPRPDILDFDGFVLRRGTASGRRDLGVTVFFLGGGGGGLGLLRFGVASRQQ